MNQDFIITQVHRVILVEKNEIRENPTVFTHYISCNELILHLSGKSTVNFNGKTLYCEENVIRFLPKGENREYTVTYEEQGECIDIFFDTDVSISEEAFTLTMQNSTLLVNLFKKMFSVWVAKNEGYYFECVSLLYRIFSVLQKQTYIPESQYLIIKPAITYINENFLSSKISVSSLAKLCGISESYLKKLFIKKFSVAPAKYILLRKVNYACDLLRSGLYTITQVAEKCGYSNVYFFSRQFKEYIGISPSEFAAKQNA